MNGMKENLDSINKAKDQSNQSSKDFNPLSNEDNNNHSITNVNAMPIPSLIILILIIILQLAKI